MYFVQSGSHIEIVILCASEPQLDKNETQTHIKLVFLFVIFG